MLAFGVSNWVSTHCAFRSTIIVPCKKCLPPYNRWITTQNVCIGTRRELGCRKYSTETRTPWRQSTPSRFLRPLRWIPLSLGFGFMYMAYLRYRYIHKRENAKLSSLYDPSEFLASNFEVSVYKMLPLKATSRIIGKINELTLPTWARPSILGAYAKTFGCKLEEADEQDLKKYRSINDFFRRALKPGIRPIHKGDCVVSPADGTILHFGKVVNGQLEQVKGIDYSVRTFLGPPTWDENFKNEENISTENYQRSLLRNPDNDLYHMVVYLAPGDYHRFHSAADWIVTFRRHFPGHLLSVRPGLVSWIAGLFNINERVAYLGQWKHGFFSMVAIGATGVGSIKVYCDKVLQTNCRKNKFPYHDYWFKESSDGIDLKKGDPFGEFNFGSTVVLLFEAPKDFKFNLEVGDKVNYGDLLSQGCSGKEQK